MPKTIVSVMPSIEVEVSGIPAGKFKDAGAAAIAKVLTMTPEEIGKMVIESLKSQPAQAYPMDFSEVMAEYE